MTTMITMMGDHDDGDTDGDGAGDDDGDRDLFSALVRSKKLLDPRSGQDPRLARTSDS